MRNKYRVLVELVARELKVSATHRRTELADLMIVEWVSNQLSLADDYAQRGGLADLVSLVSMLSGAAVAAQNECKHDVVPSYVPDIGACLWCG